MLSHDGYVIYDVVDELWLSHDDSYRMSWTRDYYDIKFAIRHYRDSMRLAKVINSILERGFESGDICGSKLELGSYVIVPLRRLPKFPDFSCAINLREYIGLLV